MEQLNLDNINVTITADDTTFIVNLQTTCFAETYMDGRPCRWPNPADNGRMWGYIKGPDNVRIPAPDYGHHELALLIGGRLFQYAHDFPDPNAEPEQHEEPEEESTEQPAEEPAAEEPAEQTEPEQPAPTAEPEPEQPEQEQPTEDPQPESPEELWPETVVLKTPDLLHAITTLYDLAEYLTVLLPKPETEPEFEPEPEAEPKVEE